MKNLWNNLTFLKERFKFQKIDADICKENQEFAEKSFISLRNRSKCVIFSRKLKRKILKSLKKKSNLQHEINKLLGKGEQSLKESAKELKIDSKLLK